MIGTGESCVAPNDGKRKDLIIIAVGRSRYSRQPDTEARSGERATKEDMRSESTAPDSVVKQQPSEHRRSESDQGRKDEPQEAATEGPIGDLLRRNQNVHMVTETSGPAGGSRGNPGPVPLDRAGGAGSLGLPVDRVVAGS